MNAIGIFSSTMPIVLRISVLLVFDPNIENPIAKNVIVFNMNAIIMNSIPG